MEAPGNHTEQGPGTGGPGSSPYAPREGRIARSWRLTEDAWALVKRDRTLVILALWSAVFGIGIAGLILYLGGYFRSPSHTSGHLALVAAIGAYPATFTSVFFNVALVSAAREAMDGGHFTTGQALAAARSRLGRIATWSLLAAGVGVLLEQLASRLPWGGRIAAWLFGAAWALATIFVVPVLVVEDREAMPAVRRSASLIKERWGEGLSGTLTISAWLFIVAIPAGILIGAGAAVAQSSPSAGTVLIVAGIAGLMLVSAMASAVRQIFALALYRFAAEGTVTTFSEEDLRKPFHSKRRDD